MSYRRAPAHQSRLPTAVGRYIAICASGTLLFACQGSSAPAPSPSASPTHHPTVTAAVLQNVEVPAALSECTNTGSIATYLVKLKAADAALAARMTERWQQLRAKGAVDAAISLFASDPSACNAELAVTSRFKAAASLVAVFADEGQAERAWAAGILGFVPPAPDQIGTGLVRGAATKLGVSSWTYDRPSVRLACWRRSVYVSLLVLANLDINTYRAMTTAIDARLN